MPLEFTLNIQATTQQATRQGSTIPYLHACQNTQQQNIVKRKEGITQPTVWTSLVL